MDNEIIYDEDGTWYYRTTLELEKEFIKKRKEAYDKLFDAYSKKIDLLLADKGTNEKK